MEIFQGILFNDDNSFNPKKSYLKMYLKSIVKVQKATLDYTLFSMMAEIGGYTSLILGISLADFSHILDSSVGLFWRKWNQETK